MVWKSSSLRLIMTPGLRLRELRLRLGITTRHVENASRQIATAESNPDYYISNHWLTKLENSLSVPSIHKLVSLSIIYQIKFYEMVKVFGIDLGHSATLQLETRRPQKRLLRSESENPQAPISFPVRVRHDVDLETTNLLSRLIQEWADVPIAAIQHLDLRPNQYGFIGFDDYTLYPLLRPGSFVQIDPHLRKIRTSRHRTEFDRPIYFLEFHDEYACGWCEMCDRELTLVPHPLSPCQIRRFHFPDDVEVVGQVIAVAMQYAMTLARRWYQPTRRTV
jgi:transcriptional regulator with XRE-family HTH domain